VPLDGDTGTVALRPHTDSQPYCAIAWAAPGSWHEGTARRKGKGADSRAEGSVSTIGKQLDHVSNVHHICPVFNTHVGLQGGPKKWHTFGV